MRNLTKSAQSLSNKASRTFVSAIDKVQESNILLELAIEKADVENGKDSQKIEELQIRIRARESENYDRRVMIESNENFIKKLKDIIE